MDEANQCLGCKKPRCQQGCPIQTNIPEVIRLLKANKLDEAGRKAGIVRCCLNPPPVKNPIFAHFTLYKIHTNIKAATPAAWHDTAGVAVIYGR